MLVYMNFTEVRGPYGGANAFLRALRGALAQRGVRTTNDLAAKFDLAFLNALTDDLDLARVQRVAATGRPVVHRKVGYRVSGSPEMRAVEDGVVHGDRVQIEFTPHVAHTVFQSEYSRDVFLASGFDGPFSVIPNGVDESLFNLDVKRPFRAPRLRSFWNGSEPLRVVVSTWSTDENKGFPDYREIDARFAGRRDVELTLIGRVPSGTRFQTFRVVPPQRRRALAARLKEQHVLLQLARFETCSNALIEGINTGLPVVYLDSGANREMAAAYGEVYEGDLDDALERLSPRYEEIVGRIPANPYRISLVVDRYLELFERLVA
jgi:glycosyltransferase involved in cell wall biosynthesis